MIRQSNEKWGNPEQYISAAAKYLELSKQENNEVEKLRGVTAKETDLFRRINAASEGDSIEIRNEVTRKAMLEEEARRLKEEQAMRDAEDGYQSVDDFMDELGSKVLY